QRSKGCCDLRYRYLQTALAVTSAVRELPDERTIEHGCHCDEHNADNEPGPRSGFAVLFVCVHHRPSIAQRSRNGRAGDANPWTPQRGQDRKDPCPASAAAPGSSFLAAPG